MVGGKGRSLARIAPAGFPVPAGFLVIKSAYRCFVEENNLKAAIIDMSKPENVPGHSHK